MATDLRDTRPPPAQPIPAATIALIRDGDAGTEVLLLRRPPHSTFAPDNWVFPGGRVDAADLVLDHGGLAAGPSALEWAERMEIGEPHVATSYLVAALREAWEETGILLTTGPGLEQSDESARKALLAGRLDFAAHLREGGLRLATDRVRYIARWITPAWLPRRFDTRFFLARVDPRAHCTLMGNELTDFRWLAPAAALQAATAGAMKLLPPTVETLKVIGKLEARI